MNPKLLILLLIVILVSAWHFFVAPIFDKIDILKEEITVKENILETKKNEIARMKALEKKLEELGEETRERLNIALPSGPKKEELFVEFNALVNKKSGMSLNNINITEGGPRSSNRDGQGSREKIITVDLGINGSYDAFKRLLALIQKDLRLMDIQTIRFSSPLEKAAKQEGLTTYGFSIELLTYYY